MKNLCGGKMMPEYNKLEQLACVAAQYLEDGKTVAVGTGLPLIAANLAQKTHAPNLIIIFEAGGISPIVPTLPISVGDSRTTHKCLMAAGLAESMETMARGLVDYAFLGAAQIDMYGNINSTQIGLDHARPKVRFPGSGGANDFGSLCWETLLVLRPHDIKKFVPKIDFITTPGYLSGPGAREAAGLPPNTGPSHVITDLGVLGFDTQTKRMKIEKVHPGINIATIRENTGFELLLDTKVSETAEPTPEELRLLREIIDPERRIIGR
jgi:glutaconate CoA-transferase subunit B